MRDFYERNSGSLVLFYLRLKRFRDGYEPHSLISTMFQEVLEPPQHGSPKRSLG